MLLSDPIRFQFYGFLCVLGFPSMSAGPSMCKEDGQKGFDFRIHLCKANAFYLEADLTTTGSMNYEFILSVWSVFFFQGYFVARVNFSSSDILFDSIDNIYISNPSTLHLLIPWERWVHPIEHMELRWKSQVYFSHSHLSMFWKYISVLSCISEHILSYASLSPAERCWNRECSCFLFPGNDFAFSITKAVWIWLWDRE